jgi:hypothetical protein
MKKNKNKKRFYSFSLHAVDLEGRAYIAEREREKKGDGSGRQQSAEK